MVKKTLYSFIKDYCKGSIDTDICDNTVDMGVCFCYDIGDTEEVDTYDKTLEIIAKNVRVENVDFNASFPITLDIYKFVEKNFEKLVKVFNIGFYGYDTESIKEQDKEEVIIEMVLLFESIISGGAIERFYDEFVEVFENELLRVKK